MRYVGARAIRHELADRRIGIAADASAAQIRLVLDDPYRQGIDVDTISLHSASLEDVFLSLTGQRPTSHSPDASAQAGVTDRTDRDKETVHVRTRSRSDRYRRRQRGRTGATGEPLRLVLGGE